MVVFGTSRPVTIIRGADTREELRWDTTMGGDFDAKALFQADDRVVAGMRYIATYSIRLGSFAGSNQS